MMSKNLSILIVGQKVIQMYWESSDTLFHVKQVEVKGSDCIHFSDCPFVNGSAYKYGKKSYLGTYIVTD